MQETTQNIGGDDTYSSGDGGSGGGGRGTTTKTTNKNVASFYYSLMEAGKQISISPKNSNIPFIRLQLIINNDIEDVNLNFEALDIPENIPQLNDVYKYVSINALKITEDNIKLAILRFKIPNDWFTKNNYDPERVRLLRYHNNQWNELKTVHEGNDTKNHQYRAGTPGFSYFAIKSEKLKSIVKESETSYLNNRETEEKTTKEREEKEDEVKSKVTGMAVANVKANPAIGFAIIFIIIILGISLYLFYNKDLFYKRKKWGVRK
jgi:PGF-pre-PGF domain-containing protein